MAHDKDQENLLSLPDVIYGAKELRAVQRELQAVDDFLNQAAIRKGGEPTQMPRVSKDLDVLCSQNKIQLLDTASRRKLNGDIDVTFRVAPIVAISFASNPSADFLSKIVKWMRQNIHPQLLLQVGLQPGITAGCVLRTKNRMFDMSLRRSFAAKHEALIKLLEAD